MFEDLTETPNQGLQSIKTTKKDILQNDIELRSMAESSQSNAVIVTNAFKSYGSLTVLENLNMTVPKGVIYGLLGASGCGKTTLLRCITGMNALHHGQIEVLEQKLPNNQNVARIGYMPQATGLFVDFTIAEIFLFYGRVMGMQRNKIKERTDYLINLLMLPHQNSSIKNLSSGQQRRVSLAVAFLYEPELLILDEPTVGVDCILRQLIWDHFLTLTKNNDVTIIISTHYIEEVQQANLVGIMRGGCLIAEAPPKQLLQQHQTNKLEDIFLKLCVLQNKNKTGSPNVKTVQPIALIQQVQKNWSYGLSLKANTMKALVWKNVLWLLKNPITLTVVTLLPVMLVTLFCITIGHDPTNLTFAAVNLEISTTCKNSTSLCESEAVGCIFLKYLEREGFKMQYFSTEDSAIHSVMRTETHASITIKQNFSKALRQRVENWLVESNQSTIDIFRDVSNKHLAIHTQLSLYKTFENFLSDYAEDCGIRKEIVKVPIKWETVYGWMKPDFTDFSYPGVLLSVVFIVGVILTAWAMLLERNEASLERYLVMGINKIELLLAHVIVEWGIMFVQAALTMICTFLLFSMTIKGSLLLTLILLILTGFFGICYGLLVSCITNSQIGITMICMGTYFATIFTSGLIWPTEAMHWLMKPFCVLFPLTKPTESLRNIFHRDWNFFKQDVYFGFFSTTLWALICLLISIILIKFQRS